ncbi:hypothetical protein [Haloterrigena salinisoli]|uniref:hypothetical protein n=1 Tax=Haloterrigena salinisoli TaxID=3132747 RepID=UPI0030CC0A73
MATRNSTERVSLGDGDDEPSDGRFRLAVAVYAGALVAGVVSIAAVLTALVPGDLPVVYAVGFAGGFVGGLALASVDPRLPSRLGRSLVRRVALVAPAFPVLFGWFVLLESTVGFVVLWSALAVFSSGYVLSQLAGNRYVDAITAGEPDERWRWEPASSAVLDGVIAGLWALLAVGNVAVGNSLEALVWLLMAVGWIASGLAEGRWSFGPGRERCEVQLYERGLVKRRPYTKEFVPWREIGHVRLREDELVLDRGLRDVRFDREELEDADALLEALDRHLETAGGR